MKTPKQFNYNSSISAGIFICSGGFEDRSLKFVSSINKAKCNFEKTILLEYKSQQSDNEPNFTKLKYKLKQLTTLEPYITCVDSGEPFKSINNIQNRITELSSKLHNRTALIDISGMTHLWALSAIHSSITAGLETSVLFTEAKTYFPLKRERNLLVKAFKNLDYEISSKYLQSKALKDILIIPEFGGNFRPNRQTCLIVFAGYEPNRIYGLVDHYAPGRLIVLYGVSPHKEFEWRTNLSKDLHSDLFSSWYYREANISTLEVNPILKTLESEFNVIKHDYDVAIAPQCSKMQALASYLFWRKHPEIQLVFTSPVRFNPDRYSRGARRTFIYKAN